MSVGRLVGWSVTQTFEMPKTANFDAFFIPITSHALPHFHSVVRSFVHSFIKKFIRKFLFSEEHLLAIT